MLYIEFGSRRVEILEDMARARLFGEISIEELEKEIEQDKSDLKAKEDRLKELKRVRAMNDENRELINKAMATIQKLIYNQGYVIGLNQIESVSRINGLSFNILKKETQKIENVEIQKFYEPPKYRNLY